MNSLLGKSSAVNIEHGVTAHAVSIDELPDSYWKNGHIPQIGPATVDPLTIARRAHATHQDTRQPNRFYKVAQGGIFEAVVTDGELSEWKRSHMANVPEWVVRI